MLSVPRSTARQPRKWTPAEDQTLREEVETQRRIEGEVKDWCKISQSLDGRTNKDCRKRWMNSVAGGLKKGQWSKSEDALLTKGVERYGQKWTLVADIVGSRSADQCSKRWCQSLDPILDRSEWRDSEDTILLQAVEKLGRHWKDVQQHHFPLRSKNSIKNRYTVLLRRYGTHVPRGSGSPEISTPGQSLSPYPNSESESYGPLYGDMVPSPSTVSTPETHRSWSIDEDSFSGWPANSTYSLPTTASPSASKYQHHSQADPSHSHWNWSAASVSPTLPLSPLPQSQYVNSYRQPPPSPYAPYGVPQIYAQGPSFTSTQPSSQSLLVPHHTMATTRSPSMPTSMAFQDASLDHRYIRHGPPADPSYRY